MRPGSSTRSSGGCARARLRPASVPACVVHATTQRGWRGGEQQLMWLHGRLGALGVRQRIVCPRGSEIARRAAAAGAEVVEVPRRGIDPRFAAAIAREASAGDLVHAHDAGAHAGAVIAAAIFRARAPIVLSRRVVFPVGRGPLTRWKYDHPAVRRILCSSRAVADVVRGAIDPDRFAPGRGSGRLRQELGVPEGATLVGTVAALSPEKDPLTFVEVAARLLGEG